LIILDDVGFGASSTFGGPVETPTLERLAKNGLRYTQFHTTALSSPTRASLLTGRNHHSVHTGSIMEVATGYPGYDSMMGKDTATIGEILRLNGWSTAWFGKNHNVPDFQTSQVGPFDLWPTGLGFEHFYGFIGADANQWRPPVIDGTNPIEPYLGNPDYHFDDDMADQAIKWINTQKALAPEKPFLVYYAPGATHAPHHPRKEWVQKYKGKFDQGWDRVREETLARQKKMRIVPQNTRLTARHSQIAAWDSLNAEQKKVYATMMEVYAGFLNQTDHNAGRVLDAITKLGLLDNTLVIYIVGDNGASPEGLFNGAVNELASLNRIPEDFKNITAQMKDLGTWKTYNHYPIGWAHAMDTPFQYTKQYASHYGGTRNGMVVSWPGRITDKGGLRSQWHHVIDIMPTILEACNVRQPSEVNGVKQKPIEGVSMAYTFADPKAASRRTTQYFEIMGSRGLYHDGWVACTAPIVPIGDTRSPSDDIVTGYTWELYDTRNDFSEAYDLARKHPEKLEELKALFYAEINKYNVLPLDQRKAERMDVSLRPGLTHGRTEFPYYGSISRIPEGSAPDIKNRSFRISAEVHCTKNNEQGVMVTQGGLFSGYALTLKDGRPVFYYNFMNIDHYKISSPDALTPGKHAIVFDFIYDGGGFGKGGRGIMTVDDKEVAHGRIEKTVPFRFSLDETFDVGMDTGTPVSEEYDVPWKFTGTLEKIVVVPGKLELSPVQENAVKRAANARD
ncbi:MAG: arylsulfatase, partial [Syntrophorhabdus sp.]